MYVTWNILFAVYMEIYLCFVILIKGYDTLSLAYSYVVSTCFMALLAYYNALTLCHQSFIFVM